MADIFSIFVNNLAGMGFFSFLLPWLFVFAIVYGLLERAKLFGGINSRVAAVLALVIAFFVAGYAGPAISAFFATLFPGATMILSLILVFVMFWLLLKPADEKDAMKSLLGGKLFFILLAVLLLIGAWVVLGGSFGGIVITEQIWSIVFFLVVIALVVWFVGGARPEPKKQ